MWIRCQDKINLMNNPLRIYIIKSNKIISDFEIQGTTYDECICLGIYKSKERALEVLDEIQAYLENNYLSINDMPQHNNGLIANGLIANGLILFPNNKQTVYQMPKE